MEGNAPHIPKNKILQLKMFFGYILDVFRVPLLFLFKLLDACLLVSSPHFRLWAKRHNILADTTYHKWQKLLKKTPQIYLKVL